jgi:hypothetical protein
MQTELQRETEQPLARWEELQAELCVEAMVLGGKIGIDDDGNPILLKIGSSFQHDRSLIP